MERSPSPPLPPDPRTLRPSGNGNVNMAPSPALRPQSQQQPVQPPDITLSHTPARPRAASKPPPPPPVLHQPQPMREALHDAFETAVPVAQSNQLDPELIRQVTEQVIRNLQQSNLSGATPTPTPQTSTFPPQQQQYVPPPPPPVQSSMSQAFPRAQDRLSPAQSSTDSLRGHGQSQQRQWTPPSPEKREGGHGYAEASSSPERVPSESAAGSTYSRESLRSKASIRSREPGSGPGPPVAMANEGVNGVRRRTSTRRTAVVDEAGKGVEKGRDEDRRRRDSGSETSTATRRRDGSVSQSQPQQQYTTRDRQNSRGSESEYYDAQSLQQPSQPQARNREQARSRVRPPRIPSDVHEIEGMTTLEKIWGVLFDNSNPTVRLSQFLRGLAIHLIEDYEPKSTLVVTPPKMLRFFQEVKLSNELYPWETIFGGKMSHANLSIMYRKLGCQHHLVQYQSHEIPSVPGLTPSGFEWFLTTLILAHPEMEFERLSRALTEMPISNADNKSERFPKELSRRLLPAQGNWQAEQKIIGSLAHEPLVQVQLRGAVNGMPPPPASAPPVQQQQRGGEAGFGERERMPYSQASQASQAAPAFVEDEDLGAPAIAMPIERERKPYTAREGRGKNYGGEGGEREREGGYENRPPTSQRMPVGESSSPPRAVGGANTRATRSGSNYTGNNNIKDGSSQQSNGGSEPVNIPSASTSRGHRQSMGQGPPPAMFNNMTNNGNGGGGGGGGGGLGGMMNGSLPKRRQTPPPRNPWTRSEPVDINGIPSSQYTSNLYPGHGLGGGGARDGYGVGVGETEDDDRRRNHRRRNSVDRDFARDRSMGNTAKDEEGSGRGYPIPPPVSSSSRRRNSIDRERPATRNFPPTAADDDGGIGGGMRGYPIPPRPPPSSQAFANGMDPVGYNGGSGGMPVGSYPRATGFMDGRRSTWYGGNNAAGPGSGAGVGGSDGYGSFSAGGNGSGQQAYGGGGGSGTGQH
ncbi:hypothetical protein LTR56_006332 [Elasticomyces elasticus]|nr:hypothetical protein LTR56_006332 [Elasticomyces elasticus]KAK3663380.1 hypothetical protein LTR22_005787 [Elasticomyces elasticus]KAK4925459.1 hypothetical protein LTR49_007523 [Elasticomyces elasticus]KAK5764554.1 hypothetical protein LTS12_005284 [Elasticomyces elasticus]